MDLLAFLHPMTRGIVLWTSPAYLHIYCQSFNIKMILIFFPAMPSLSPITMSFHHGEFLCALCAAVWFVPVLSKTTHNICEFHFEPTDVSLSLNIDINGGGVSSIYRSMITSFQSMPSFLSVSTEEEFQGLSISPDLS